MNRDARSPDGASPAASLALFGKHPGWDDHMADQGMETENLVALKRLLYIEGIGGNIDSSAWEKLPPDHRLDGFRHDFLWADAGTWTVGRIWSSRDRKGRSRYPMIVCLESCVLPLPLLLEDAVPRLEELETVFRQLSSDSEVRWVSDQARDHIRATYAQEMAAAPTVPEAYQHGGSLADFAQAVAAGGDGLGFQRLHYKLARDRERARETGEPEVSHLRVPAMIDDRDKALAWWYAMAASLGGPAIPLLLVRHEAQPWLDLLLGRPAARHLFCLLASEQALPPVTRIPYTIDPAVAESAAEQIRTWRAPGMDLTSLFLKPRPLAPAAAGRGGLLKVFSSVRSSSAKPRGAAPV